MDEAARGLVGDPSEADAAGGFGWAKGVAGLSKRKQRGQQKKKAGWRFPLAAAADRRVKWRNRRAAAA